MRSGRSGAACPSLATPAAILQAMMFVGVMLNLVLAFFNLLPVPPLDGSHVFKYLLPPAWSLHYQRIGFLGIFLLMLLLPVLQPVFIGPVSFLLGQAANLTQHSMLPRTIEILRAARIGS